jgi:hypothetical protein
LFNSAGEITFQAAYWQKNTQELFMKAFKLYIASATALLLTACSGSTEDVQLTLCKQLAGDLVFGDYKKSDWLAEDMKFKGYDDLEVIVRYNTESGEGETRCYYAYDTPEENAMTQSNPATAYSSYPSKITQDGTVLESGMWAQKINEINLKQGKEAIKVPVEKARQAVQEVKTKLQQ